jgi:hypothetical protein
VKTCIVIQNNVFRYMRVSHFLSLKGEVYDY